MEPPRPPRALPWLACQRSTSPGEVRIKANRFRLIPGTTVEAKRKSFEWVNLGGLCPWRKLALVGVIETSKSRRIVESLPDKR